jgi:hypothetical protein
VGAINEVQNKQSETTTKQENNEVVRVTVFGTISCTFSWIRIKTGVLFF